MSPTQLYALIFMHCCWNATTGPANLSFIVKSSENSFLKLNEVSSHQRLTRHNSHSHGDRIA